jgi:hypothetical protein
LPAKALQRPSLQKKKHLHLLSLWLRLSLHLRHKLLL